MSRFAYVNGRFLPFADAGIGIEDRGLQFADSLYEVSAVFNGVMLDHDAHLARLARGRAALRLPEPMSDRALTHVMHEVLRRNRVRTGYLYLQLTRGVARRDHVFPAASTPPSLILTARSADLDAKAQAAQRGIAVVSQPDQRWARVSIKTTGLLPNVLAKQAAREAGAQEAWLVKPDGTVVEGGSTNAWMVDRTGTVLTHPEGDGMLSGVMRATLISVAKAAQIRVEERPFTLDQAKAGAEAFLTATSAPCTPIIRIDGAPVGDGRPGPVVRRLFGLMADEIARQTGYRLTVLSPT